MARSTLILGVVVLMAAATNVLASHPRSGVAIGIGGGGIAVGVGVGSGGGYHHGGYYGGHGPYSYPGGVSVGVGIVPVPAPIYVQQPTYVAPTYAAPSYEQPSEDSGEYVPAPTNEAAEVQPAKKATIKIVNPSSNTQTLGYTLDGKYVYHIKPGESQELDQEYEIAFDRSNGLGAARYSLTSGTYKFTPKEDGSWELYNND